MKNVLIVDDDPGCLLLLQKMLEKKDCEIAIARDGETALKIAEERIYDLVIMDIMMPGLNGVEVVEKLRQTQPDCPPYVALITAFDIEQYKQDAHTAGANEILSKTSGLKSFPVRIKELIERAAQYRAAYSQRKSS